MESCFHCGDDLPLKPLLRDEHAFCCTGCVSVYELLKSSRLGQFYEYEKQSGSKPSAFNQHQYDFLDIPEIRAKYIDYEDEHQARITLYLPSIHCSSCIYLLENLHQIKPSVKQVFTQFSRKEASFTFDPSELKLSELAVLLSQIGYQPNFGNRNDSKRKLDKTFLYKLGVAGFAFGSIMLWSFPEYFGVEEDNPFFRKITAYMSLAVSIPVLVYSARDYFISAWKALKHKHLNLDVPITLGIIALYAQSVYSILNHEGYGYIDSFAGFIFFLLIGKWFQQKTYTSFSFERDYTSYFPVAVSRMENGVAQIREIEQLEPGDELLIRNEEIIPCDAILLDKVARIDFSFVTGEADLVLKNQGDFIYAGGKIKGPSVRMEVKHKSDRSHLTRLWNESGQTDKNMNRSMYQDKLSGWFLLIVLGIATAAGLYWFIADSSQATRVIVSVLIVTCPCALALSAPFTLGNVMRLLGRKGLYLKNALVTEKINQVTDIVFDKTGTLTALEQQVSYRGTPLSDVQFQMILAACSASLHPLSQAIRKQLEASYPTDKLKPASLVELAGQGLEVSFNDGVTLRLGSATFVGCASDLREETMVFVAFNEVYAGYFLFKSRFRNGIDKMIPALSRYQLHLLTGDQERDKEELERLFPKSTILHFGQSPEDKLDYIRQLQNKSRKVLMIGDGLNDAGALREAYVGFAVSEDAFRFSPASDAILDSRQLVTLPNLLRIASKAKSTLAFCLSFSVIYNIIGLSFAVSGQLTPLLAAILMPISSITVVLISTFTVWFGRRVSD